MISDERWQKFDIVWLAKDRLFHYPDLVVLCGGMAEWLKAAVLKTVVPRGTVGSNPTSSASKGLMIVRSLGDRL